MRSIGVRHLVARRLKTRTLWYWQPTPTLIAAGFAPHRLRDELPRAIEQAEAWNAQVDAWRRGTAPPPAARAGTLTALGALYERDAQFTRLKPRSRADHTYHAATALDWAGDVQVRAITRKAIKAWLRGVLAGRGPSAMRGAGAALRRLLSFAADEGWITTHPALRLRLPTPTSRERVWTESERNAFCAQAEADGRPSLALAVTLGWWLAQRPADLRTLAWTAYDGAVVQLRQGKTDRLVRVPALPPLQAALEAAPRRGPLVVQRESDNEAWGESAFQHAFAKVREAAGLPDDLQFRDLRRTGATNLGRAGCTDDEIRAITGHTTRGVVAVYVRPDDTYARNAMDKLAKAGEKVVAEAPVESQSKGTRKRVERLSRKVVVTNT